MVRFGSIVVAALALSGTAFAQDVEQVPIGGQTPVGYTSGDPRLGPRLRTRGWERRNDSVATSLLVEGQLGDAFATYDAAITLQQRKWSLDFDARTVLDKDSNPDSARMNLFNAFIGFAPWPTRHGRLYLDLGAMSVLKPGVFMMGPAGGVTLRVPLFGVFGLEGSVRGTPWPYRELEWNAALGLNLGVLTCIGGWRQIYLDDRGLADGTDHQDRFSGPYAAVALTF